MKHRTSGMTLIELMVVVAIISILAAIAVPAYGDYVRRGNRTLAKTSVTEIASRQESWLSDRKAYATALTSLGYPAQPFYVGKSGNPQTAVSGAMYSVTLVNPTATSFTVQATALSGQLKDTDCKTMSLTSLGAKSSTDSANADSTAKGCWSR